MANSLSLMLMFLLAALILTPQGLANKSSTILFKPPVADEKKEPPVTVNEPPVDNMLPIINEEKLGRSPPIDEEKLACPLPPIDEEKLGPLPPIDEEKAKNLPPFNRPPYKRPPGIKDPPAQDNNHF